MRDRLIELISQVQYMGGVVFVKQGHLRCAVPVMLAQRKKGGE